MEAEGVGMVLSGRRSRRRIPRGGLPRHERAGPLPRVRWGRFVRLQERPRRVSGRGHGVALAGRARIEEEGRTPPPGVRRGRSRPGREGRRDRRGRGGRGEEDTVAGVPSIVVREPRGIGPAHPRPLERMLRRRRRRRGEFFFVFLLLLLLCDPQGRSSFPPRLRHLPLGAERVRLVLRLDEIERRGRRRGPVRARIVRRFVDVDPRRRQGEILRGARGRDGIRRRSFLGGPRGDEEAEIHLRRL
mmetsp:Transcript_43688/g.132926  ORF Transcript_43688/g.132926 Transcript_43688/m.132926 type:complete len:245 (+) Transcript_43688:761-1495(+)